MTRSPSGSSRELPADAVVTHVTMIAYRGDKAVVAWKSGVQTLPEGEAQPGESAEAAARRILLEQVGVSEGELKQLGHFRCRATSQHPTLPNNAITYQVLYGVEVGALADFPTDGVHERRIILQRDLNTILRSGYVERRREYTDTLDHWLLQRLKPTSRPKLRSHNNAWIAKRAVVTHRRPVRRCQEVHDAARGRGEAISRATSPRLTGPRSFARSSNSPKLK